MFEANITSLILNKIIVKMRNYCKLW